MSQCDTCLNEPSVLVQWPTKFGPETRAFCPACAVEWWENWRATTVALEAEVIPMHERAMT